MNKYQEAGKRLTEENIKNGKYNTPTQDDFKKEFPDIILAEICDPNWSDFHSTARETLNQKIEEETHNTVSQFLEELDGLFRKYPNMQMGTGCGCCDFFGYVCDKYTRTIPYVSPNSENKTT